MDLPQNNVNRLLNSSLRKEGKYYVRCNMKNKVSLPPKGNVSWKANKKIIYWSPSSMECLLFIFSGNVTFFFLFQFYFECKIYKQKYYRHRWWPHEDRRLSFFFLKNLTKKDHDKSEEEGKITFFLSFYSIFVVFFSFFFFPFEWGRNKRSSKKEVGTIERE